MIFGARDITQLEDNVKAEDVTLSDAQVKALDEASSYDLGYPYTFLKNVQNTW